MCSAQRTDARETDTETQRHRERSRVCVRTRACVLEGGAEGKSRGPALECSSGSKTLWLSLEPEEKRVISLILKGKRRKIL